MYHQVRSMVTEHRIDPILPKVGHHSALFSGSATLQEIAPHCYLASVNQPISLRHVADSPPGNSPLPCSTCSTCSKGSGGRSLPEPGRRTRVLIHTPSFRADPPSTGISLRFSCGESGESGKRPKAPPEEDQIQKIEVVKPQIIQRTIQRKKPIVQENITEVPKVGAGKQWKPEGGRVIGGQGGAWKG